MCSILDLREPGSPRDLSERLNAVDWLPDGWREADYLLIGEVHDNPGHHATQAASLIASPVDPSRRRALVVEHIRADQQAAFDAVARAWSQTAAKRDIGALFGSLDWEKSGWPDQTMFAPIFRNALDNGMPILAGEPPRDTVRGIARGGASAIALDEQRRLGLEQPLPAKLQEALLDELEGSHCRLMPRTAFTGMALAQRYRDAHMAQAMLKAARDSGASLLFAGNGHVRKDRGVPYYLRTSAPGKSILVVMQVEVEDDKTNALAYIPRDADGKPVADYLFITTRTERPDPCVEMKARFGKK